jgi:anaerobic selenocysteine-containing dehydrogenase
MVLQIARKDEIMNTKWKQGTENDYIVKTHAWSAPGCHPVGCGLKLHVKDGKLIGVEGDEDDPITNGRLCVRCLTLPEFVNHPQRVLYPMLRAGERGENKWKRITWDEAYDLICEKTKYFTETYGPESICVFGGTGREGGQHWYPLAFAVLGTPNCCYSQSGWSCYAPRAAMSNYVLGAGYPEIDNAGYFKDRYDDPEYKLPEYIVLWGKAPLESNPDGFFGHSIIDMMKRGSKLITVDPRATWLSAKAEYHLQLRPGTDAALALGMLNVIINEELYDHDFVENWTYGFEELSERVQEYPPAKVAEICWVPEEQLVNAARAIANAENATFGWGLAVDQNPNGCQIGQALICMMALTANIDNPGGTVLGPNTSLLGHWRHETFRYLPPELWDKRIGAEEYPGAANMIKTVHPDVFLDTLESGKPYQLHMAWFHNNNLLSPTNSAQPKRWYNALKKLDFIIVNDVCMTPTAAALADLFLPVASFAEKDTLVFTHYGMNTVTMSTVNKAVQVGEVKSDIEVMLDLGHRLKPEIWPWNDPKEFWTDQLKGGVGFTFDELRDMGTYQPKNEYYKYEKGLLREDGQPGFRTITGKIELYSLMYENFGDDPLPYYQEPPYSPISTPEEFEKYPFILTTGARKYTSFHSEQRHIASLREIDPYPTFDIHPDAAAALGIKQGDWCVLENMFGSCKQVANVTPIIDPRVIQASHGWWYPEQEMAEPNLGGNWKSQH